jgi:DNA-binding LytR/AlgR family response regulator
MVQAYEVEAFFIRGRELDLLFLDIGLKGMSGIELGKKIREE